MTTPIPLTVLIVEDHPLLREGLKMTLESVPGIVVTGEAADGFEAIRQAVETKPAVILMDIGLPKLDGVEASKIIKQKVPDSHLLMLTSRTEDEEIFAALAAGANGYCLKAASKEQILTAIRTVGDGGAWLDPAIANRVLGRSHAAPKENSDNLSNSDKELLALIMNGASNERISLKMKWSESDVDTRIQEVLTKLSQSTQAQSALKSMQDKTPGQTTTSNMSDRFLGTTVDDRYEVFAIIGQGGGGIVYKARHKFINRQVALKIINPEQRAEVETLQRFRMEAEAASGLKHYNVVTVYDFGLTSDGHAYMVMDLLEGPSLLDLILRVGHIPLSEAINIFAQICNGMEHAHNNGVVHRDLKPSNIHLVTEGGQTGIVKILDFGIAKLLDLHTGRPNDITRVGEVFGSPLYMSPEQCRGQSVDSRSDIYSMGCLMYECLTGKPPHAYEDVYDTFYHQVHTVAQPFATIAPSISIPQTIERVVSKAMMKNPNDRYQTMAELKGALILAARQISTPSS